MISRSLVGDKTIDVKNCFMDEGHLRYAGCIKITSDLMGGVIQFKLFQNRFKAILKQFKLDWDTEKAK